MSFTSSVSAPVNAWQGTPSTFSAIRSSRRKFVSLVLSSTTNCILYLHYKTNSCSYFLKIGNNKNIYKWMQVLALAVVLAQTCHSWSNSTFLNHGRNCFHIT